MSLPYSVESMLAKVQTDLARQQDALLMTQLNELVSRGLLVIEKTQPTFVQSINSDAVEIRQQIRLVLKDQEYIQKLEQEVKELRDERQAIANAVEGFFK